ncbi:ATP-binding cassette domain-containing protein [Candidatus Pelagibacter bacterium nBUS_30]|uniref:ATP-binding cassette domain-containing protein n=1 Tax=Candidatus Pelagibacter bacterium nBUS_30 TaxID=3374191 RepID=UPI003EC08069
MGIIKKFRIKSFKNKNPIIEFENVSLSYGNRLILDNINFKINESEIFGMLGPNGVGKSTIFNLLTGLITPSSGKIKINGKEVNSYPVYLRTKMFKIGYVPQYGGYFGDLSLADNLKAIGEIVIENKNLMNDRIDYLTSKFELENIKSIKANFLSGGQKKSLLLLWPYLVNLEYFC